MSASPTDIQALLGGLLNNPQPASVEGLLGQYGGATNLGLSILAANKPSPVRQGFGNVVAQGALDSQQLAMQQAQQRLALAQGALNLGLTGQKLGALAPFMGGRSAVTPQGQGNQQVPQQAAAAVPGQPQATMETQSQPQAVAGASAQQGLDQALINGYTADQYFRASVASGKTPAEAQKEVHALQLQAYQEQIKPQVDALDNIIKSDKPTQYVQANPQLMQAWAQGAPRLGINPQTGFTDQNVRTVLGFARNQLAAPAMLGQEAPNVPLQTRNGPLGSIYQVDPVSGKQTQVKGEEDLKQVVDPKSGLPTLVPASQAAGKQPFNASIYGAQNVSDQALQFAADTYRTTGKFPAAFGRNPAMQAKVLDKVASDAAANGDTAGSIAARSAALKANGMALDQITKREAAVTSFSTTLDKNLDSLLKSAQKVDSTGSPLINRALRAYQQGIKGDPAVAEMVTWLNAVEGEYAKLNSGSLGNAAPSVSARGDAKEVINKNFSAGGMEAVANAMRGEAHNTLSSIAEEKKGLMSSIGQSPNAAPQAKKLVYDPATGKFE